MTLEFKLYKINEESTLFKMVREFNATNEFIVVGEEIIENIDYFRVHQLNTNGLKLFGGNLDKSAYLVKKSELSLTSEGVGCDYVELDIPKKHLTMSLIETIQKLNN